MCMCVCMKRQSIEQMVLQKQGTYLEKKVYSYLSPYIKFNSKQTNNLNVILNTRTFKGEHSGNTSRDWHNQEISQNDSIFNRKDTSKIRLWKFNIWARKLTIQSKDNLNNKTSPLRLQKEYKYLEYMNKF